MHRLALWARKRRDKLAGGVFGHRNPALEQHSNLGGIDGSRRCGGCDNSPILQQLAQLRIALGQLCFSLRQLLLNRRSRLGREGFSVARFHCGRSFCFGMLCFGLRQQFQSFGGDLTGR